MSSLSIKLSFIHLIRFQVDHTKVFQRVSMNLNTTVWSIRMPNVVSSNSKHVGYTSCV